LIGKPCNSEKFSVFIREGALLWAKEMLQALLPVGADAKEEEVMVLAKLLDSSPSEGQIGRNGIGETVDDFYTYKFHWPQVAWLLLLKVITKLRSCGSSGMK